jgi:hypothetical protein
MKKLFLVVMTIQAASSEQLRITVYDGARLPPGIIAPAFEDLRAILRRAGIDVEVISGDLTAPEASHLELPAPPRKGAELAAACRARRDIALEILKTAPPQYKPSILGYAQPLASAGLNVRVFNDRIRWAAAEGKHTHSTFLAHVMAHEIGHVLLRSGEHSSWGLMSPAWREHDHAWMSRSLMFFSRQQATAMRMELSAAKCPASVSVAGNR